MARDPDAAIARYQEALALIAALQSESPANPRYIDWGARATSNLGLILVGTGMHEEAVEIQRQAVALAEQVADDVLRLGALATSRNNLAEALAQAKRPAKAETVFRQSLQQYRALADVFPKSVDYRWGVAMSLTNLAGVVLEQGRAMDAREPIEESGRFFAELKKAVGTNTDFQQNYEKHTHIRDEMRRVEGKSP